MTTLADLRLALDAVAAVLAEHEPRHRGRWRSQSVIDHVRHAADHLTAYEAGDRTEDHLGHAACRLLMALVLAAEEGKA